MTRLRRTLASLAATAGRARVKSTARRALTLAMLFPIVLLAQQRDPRSAAPVVGTNEISVLVVGDDAASRPVRRVSVSLQAGELVSPRTVVTDDEGRAVFRGIAAGNYTLTAVKPGFVRTYYGSKIPWRGPGVAIAVFDGKAVPAVRMKLVRGGVISGTVRTMSGRPAANVNVTALNTRAAQDQNLQAMAESMTTAGITDDRGVYRIYGLAPGTYHVSVQAMGSSVREEIRQVTSEQLQWADKVLAGSTPAAAPVLPAPPPAGPTQSYAPVFYPGTTVINDAATITIEAGQERLGTDFALQLVTTAQVKGRVLDDQGRPQAGATVSLRGGTTNLSLFDFEPIAALGGGGGARTLQDGTFTLNAVRPGQYTLSVQATIRPPTEKPSEKPSVADAMAGIFSGGAGGTHYASQELNVAGREISDLTLVLRPSLVITGKVLFDATTMEVPKDLSTVKLSISSMDNGAMGGLGALMGTMLGGGVSVTADGAFTAKGLSPGRYRLLTPAEVMRSLQPMPMTVDEGWTLKSVTVAGRDVADAGIDLKQDLSGVVVAFTDHPTEISGTVYDQAGRITPDFPIVVFSTDRTAWVTGSRRVRQGRPASDGRYRIVGLPAGEYFVCAVTAVEQNELNDAAFLTQLAASSFKITLRDGQKLAQDLKLGGGH